MTASPTTNARAAPSPRPEPAPRHRRRHNWIIASSDAGVERGSCAEGAETKGAAGRKIGFHGAVETPSAQVKQLERLFKNVWARVEEARLKYRPRHGYLTLAQAEAIMHKYLDRAVLPADVDREAAHSQYSWQLLMLAAWRMTKGIYRYEPMIYDDILGTPLDEALPCAILQSLPEWCVYVETPGFVYEGVPRAGFLFCVFEGYNSSPVALAWYGDGTSPIPCPLEQTSILQLRERFFRDRPAIESAIHRALSLSLYLCARNADIGDGTHRPGNPEPTKTKHGLRTFPREQVRTWEVGRRIAAQLRDSAARASEPADAAEVERARPRPHTRRAHEHRYWMKNEEGEKVLVSRWIGLVNVNTKRADDIIETVREIPDDGVLPASSKIRMH